MKINPWMISTFLLVLIVALMGVFTFTRRASIVSAPAIGDGAINPMYTPTSAPPLPQTPPGDSVDTDHQIYVNSVIASSIYSVTIPIGQKAGWRLTQTVSMDPYYTKGKNIGDKVEIEKDSKTITIFRPEASGPAICLFSDSPAFEGPSQKFNSFIELKLGSRPARRGKVGSNVPVGKDQYTICQKDAGSGLYTSWTEFGYISYEVPSGANVLDMDTIVGSLKK